MYTPIPSMWSIPLKRNGWRTSKNKPVKNKDLWQELDALVHKHRTSFVKVEGHSTNKFNNRCDKLAVIQSKKYEQQHWDIKNLYGGRNYEKK